MSTLAELALALAALIAAVAYAADRISAIRARRPWPGPQDPGRWTLADFADLRDRDDPDGVIDL